MVDQNRAPLFEALISHDQKSKGNFHVPGHKQGRAFDENGNRWFHPILRLDLTEVGELDDLHDPHGVIEQAQQLAARAFQAEHTLFLVGGTTAGNLATILHLCQPGDPIIVHRNCHQSVFHACILAGAVPVYLKTSVDGTNGLEMPVDPEEVRTLLSQNPKAKAVVITSPSYFGMVQPVRSIAGVCHEFDVPLVVDEAHGAHFGFHPGFPLSAMQCGADVAIQSTHKMLTSMTMSSMLHVQGKRVEVTEIARWLRMIESSSPSYPLMASLDLARRYVVQHGYDEFDKLLVHLNHFRGNIDSFRHLHEVVFPGGQDPLKLSLRAGSGITGYQLAGWLEERGCYTELADHDKVLFVFSLGTTEAELRRVADLLAELDESVPDLQGDGKISMPPLPESVSPVESLGEIKKGPREQIPLAQAVGRISTEMIVPYPPGIPLILPGEPFTPEVVDYLMSVIRQGGNVRGIFQPSAPHVSVLK
ncbi:aminotransferase class I/II-fold pyridoxal phosphate-dependent enzyme [Lihuaxuella thermophila]|uniref:Arginine/lysine/ornithine decarboxylase n=1 Tax=Lihuaxuella thermophila TaxID=1173111 RepID=A0A1H8I7G6_9BACL|nr:aminotransferase class I/II-fold pyridoxal phosphate-dependent enzyme [Lihuaxuella thermophila]SEN64750.1 Arginine/lysine/ornithine decarboxylase [Lihuaxuella thermophila]